MFYHTVHCGINKSDVKRVKPLTLTDIKPILQKDVMQYLEKSTEVLNITVCCSQSNSEGHITARAFYDANFK